MTGGSTPEINRFSLAGAKIPFNVLATKGARGQDLKKKSAIILSNCKILQNSTICAKL